jgi:ketosteroid isomerase-like protein
MYDWWQIQYEGLVMATFCHSCGATLQASSRYCPECGVAISVSESVAPRVLIPQRPRPRGPKVFIGVVLVFFIVAVIAIISSHSTSDGSQAAHEGQEQQQNLNPTLPSSEVSFISIVTSAQDEARGTQNDMQKGGVKSSRDKAMCAAMASLQVHDWVGTVKTIDSNSDGKGVLAVSIAPDVLVTTWNNSLSDFEDHTLIEPGTSVFQTASAMKPGQLVAFSGRFFPSHEGDCIQESSLTLDGKVASPDFIFLFSDVSAYRYDRAPAASENSKPSASTTQDPPANPAVEPSQTEVPVENASLNTASADVTTGSEADAAHEQIAQALQNWASAYQSNDPTAISKCYAEQVDHFFLTQNVTNAFIRDYWNNWFNAHADRVSLFKVKNLTYENETADKVTLRLVKQVVTTESSGAAERLTHSELSLTKVENLWKITSERDFK